MKPFWENTLASTIGTVIGIVLTIGTTFIATRMETRQSEKRQVKMIVQGMEQNLDAIREFTHFLEYSDSLNMLVLDHKQDLTVLADSTLGEYLGCLVSMEYHSFDMTASRIFSSNLETWRNISSTEFIDLAGRWFSILDQIIKKYEKIDGEKSQVQRAVWECNRTYTGKSFADWSEHFVQVPCVDDLMQLTHKYYLPFFQQATQLLEEKLAECKQYAEWE